VEENYSSGAVNRPSQQDIGTSSRRPHKGERDGTEKAGVYESLLNGTGVNIQRKVKK
jgi:hypothetical protein